MIDPFEDVPSYERPDVQPPSAGEPDGSTLPSAKTAFADRLTWWLLRILVGAGDMPPYYDAGDPFQIQLAEAAGVPQIAQKGLDADAVRAAIRETWQKHPNFNGGRPEVQPCHALINLDWLAQGTGLKPVERDIFELAVCMRMFSTLRNALNTWGSISGVEYTQAVSVLVGHSHAAVDRAISHVGPLYRGGLLQDVNDQFAEKRLAVLLSVPRLLAYRIESNRGHPSEIMVALVQPMANPELTLEDFSHQPDHNNLARSWLAGALGRAASGQSAGHMLVTGEPGLGKTEWVRALLDTVRQDQNALPRELVILGTEGEALTGEDRLSHLRVALTVFAHTPGSVLMFDEADDIFKAVVNSYNAEGAFNMTNNRASLNRLVETSRVPVIWVMNNPDVLDPAVLRRFDVVIRMPRMSRSTRASLLTKRLPIRWNPTELQAWSELDTLTPALIDRLATVQASALAAGHPLEGGLYRLWLKQRLRPGATRQLKLLGSSGQGTDSRWDAQAVNASHDLAGLVDGIQRSGSARILMHGDPGTGKTAFAHELARLLDKPLRERRASDLLSPYVGETEQHIAGAFEEAIEDDVVLLLDEADSLLASRDQAHRQWEVTQVNELLEQLGEFPGVLVLATNRLSSLDGAVLRRMDIKVEFLPLTPAQIQTAFVRLCKQLDLTLAMEDVRAAVQLQRLTPGDFACIARRHAFAPMTSSRELLDALVQEVALRTGNRQPVGFRAPTFHVGNPMDEGSYQDAIDALCGPP